MTAIKGIGVGLAMAVIALAFLGSASAVPPRAEGRIYANGELYATFVSTTVGDAPGQSFDALFTFPGTDLISVAEAAPGEAHYNGGRWIQLAVTFTGMAPEQFMDDSEVWFHYNLGHLTITDTGGRVICPLISL